MVKKLAAVIENRAVSMSVKGTNIKELQSGSWDEMFDGNAETFALTKGAQKTGDYITVDLGRTQAINDITFWTADGDQKIYDAKVSVSKNNKDFEKVATWNSESGTVNPPRREYKADAKGKEGRYVRLEVTANNNNPLKIFEVEVNKGQKAPGTISPEFALTSDEKADKKALTDKNLATVFQISQTDDKSYLEYRITDNVNLDSFTVLQAGSCDAKVILKTADGKLKELGNLTKSTQEFNGWEENVHAVRFEFPAKKDVKLNEIIFKYGENPSGDIGEAVDNIPIDPGAEDSKETVNLALNQPVEVSGIETNNVKPESAVDGNEGTKWDSAALKGSGAKSPQWIIVDLGTYTNMISEIKMSYFNKVYPTDYDVQVSNDKENWVTVKTITKQNNGPVNPVDTVKEELTQPVAARYVRILFRSINANAAGNCIGLKELTVNGVRRHVPVSYTSVAELENVNAEVNAENVALPALVETTVKAGEEKEQPLKVIPTWDTEKIDTSKPADITVTGTLPINYSLVNPEALEAQVHVIVGEGGTEPENPERTNLALNQKVEVSDVETDFDGSKTDYVGEYAVDGKADTRWSSGPLNSKLGLGGEPKDQYIVVDLGAGKNTIDEIKVSYFKKVWPTNYTVEVSADKNTWETVKTIKRNSSNDLNVVDDFKLEEAKNARYVRLSFPKDGLNTNAAGSSVSITELEVYGTKEDITIDIGVLEEKIASAKELIKNAEAEPNKYDSATVEVLKEALEVAENTLKNPESQEQVNKAAEELATAEAGLKELDLDALNVALKEAEEILAAESDYTPETYKVFKAAYEEAKALLGKPMTQQQAEEAKAKLETAQEQLEKVEIVENEGWKETENGWEYYENGQKVIGWLYTGNHWYYMDDNGIMVTGWAAVDGHWYYMDQWGAMCTGWVSVDGHWYYMDQWGAMCTGWVSVDGHWYYMDQWGAMQTGWVLVGDTWYYMNNSGAMQTGWVLVGDTWYYLNDSGAMCTGWLFVGDTWYYLNDSGAMCTGWVSVGGHWYYMDQWGAMCTGWALVGDDWYYLNADGTMASNQWIGGYYVDASGKMV